MRVSLYLFRLFILLVLLCSSYVVSAAKIVIVADDWCPYNCEPNTELPGYVVEIVQYIFSRHDIEVEYRYVSWELAVQGVEKGDYDAVIGATLVEVPSGIFPQEPIGKSQTQFIKRAGNNWRYYGVDSLKNIKLGGIKSYDYGEAINTYIETANPNHIHLLIGDNATELNLSGLYRGAIDAFADDKNVISNVVNRLGLSKEFQIAGEEGDADPIYVAFSPKLNRSQEYAEILSKGIQEMRGDGHLMWILNRYGLKDWQ